MIVVMKLGSTQRQVEHVVKLVREMGLKDHVIVGTELTVVACIGDDRNKDRSVLETVDGVDKVVPILAPYKMASREVKKERSAVPLGGKIKAKIGGPKVGVIAGPCSVESKQQTLEIAHAVKEAGAVGLRGGAFKPRTNPYSFQGLAEKGLQILAEAREQTGLAVVTEVMAVDQVKLVADYADVLQVGARNMQNFNLLNAVGEQRKPVLLKRGMSATLEEFLLAAEYIMSKGNDQVMLCERGIRTYEDYVRNTLALAAVPELHRVSHLPVTLFHDLLSAFRQDVVRKRYATWEEVLDYCRRSANPVGRLVLGVAGRLTPALGARSDDVCTALQLTNFWQDIGRDWQNGRLYVPASALVQAGAREEDVDAPQLTAAWKRVMADMVQRTRALFESGRAVCDGVDGRLRWELRLTWLGGSRILDRIEAADYDVVHDRPKLGATDAPLLLARAMMWRR